ncbi:MAG TPA: transposase, partial [Clostridia bacterium]|nr:transposase [Clostridia bacterium]
MSVLGIQAAVTGAFLAVFPGNWKVHDFRLFVAAMPFFKTGDIVVGDRAFCAYTSLAWLRSIGADMICRLHQRRKFDPSVAKRNAPNNWTVIWKKGVHNAKSPVPEEQFESFSDELPVRIVKSSMHRNGFRSENIYIATTLLDATLYPASLISDLYFERWGIEESFRDLKDSMRYDFIRSRSPASVMKTLKTMFIAHNLIRAISGTAARKHKVRWQRISFKGAAVSIRLFLVQRLIQGTTRGIANFRRLLVSIATDLVQERPGRREPRA